MLCPGGGVQAGSGNGKRTWSAFPSLRKYVPRASTYEKLFVEGSGGNEFIEFVSSPAC